MKVNIIHCSLTHISQTQTHTCCLIYCMLMNIFLTVFICFYVCWLNLCSLAWGFVGSQRFRWLLDGEDAFSFGYYSLCPGSFRLNARRSQAFLKHLLTSVFSVADYFKGYKHLSIFHVTVECPIRVTRKFWNYMFYITKECKCVCLGRWLW